MTVRTARRTSHIDMRSRGASTGDGLELSGAARDVCVGGESAIEVVAEATVRAVLASGLVLEQLASDPAIPGQAVTDLAGRPVAGGFRAAVAGVLGDHDGDRGPLRLLLDDLPVASLIAGYADLYRQPVAVGERPSGASSPKADICAGWASDATMMRAIRTEGRIPVPVGPPAPDREAHDDLRAWHGLDPVPPGGMRRRRRLDVSLDRGGTTLAIDAMFRDTHVDAGGDATVLHEWSVEVTVDPSTWTIIECRATPHVLPWTECPSAAGSAARLVGRTVGELRRVVGDELRGTSTCTHLNDLLRSLADVPHLAALLR